MNRIRRLVLAVPVLAALAGCGTTVAVPLGSDASGVVAPAVRQGGPPNESAPVTAGGTRNPSQDVAPTLLAGRATPGGQSLPARTGQSGHLYREGVPGFSQGITTSTISLGVVILKNGGAFAHGLGFSLSYGDTKLEFDALLADLNRRGGIHGRRVVPVYAYEDVTSPDPQSTLCSTFTQDHHVFAVLMPFNPGADMASCITKSHTLLLNNSTLQPDNDVDSNYRDWLFGPSMASYARYPSWLVGELVGRGWFADSGGRAGLVVLDSPEFTRPASKVLAPLLERQGIRTTVVAVSPTSYASQIQTAIIQFQQLGISRVLFMQSGGGIPLYFMQDADKQHYMPKYALSSYESPNWFLAQYAPAAQLVNSVGIGWQPFMDVAVSSYPSTPEEQRCFDVEKQGGETNANRISNITATTTCDLVWSFEAAAVKAGPDLTSEGWRAAYARLGSSYRSVTTLAVNWAGVRNDGADAYRWLEYSTPCACFRYSGPLTRGAPSESK